MVDPLPAVCETVEINRTGVTRQGVPVLNRCGEDQAFRKLSLKGDELSDMRPPGAAITNVQ